MWHQCYWLLLCDILETNCIFLGQKMAYFCLNSMVSDALTYGGASWGPTLCSAGSSPLQLHAHSQTTIHKGKHYHMFLWTLLPHPQVLLNCSTWMFHSHKAQAVKQCGSCTILTRIYSTSHMTLHWWMRMINWRVESDHWKVVESFCFIWKLMTKAQGKTERHWNQSGLMKTGANYGGVRDLDKVMRYTGFSSDLFDFTDLFDYLVWYAWGNMERLRNNQIQQKVALIMGEWETLASKVIYIWLWESKSCSICPKKFTLGLRIVAYKIFQEP